VRVPIPFHIALCITVLACGQRSPQQEGAGASTVSRDPSDTTFRVALLTPGPVSDHAWNGGAYDGLLRIRDSLHAQISNIETKTPADFEENFRQYGAQGYNIVFGHGFEFQDAAERVAKEYPKTVFVTTSGDRTGANLVGITFNFQDGAYLAGIVAGGMAETGTIGVIGGTELPPVKSSFAAFAAGAQSVNPKIKVLSSYIGNWDDVSAGKEQAVAQINRGASVIFQNADAAGLGVFEAVKEAPAASQTVKPGEVEQVPGVYVFGANSNQNDLAPSVTLGSVVIDLPRAFLMIAREVHDGHFVPGPIVLGAKEHVVTLVLNPALVDHIPSKIRTAVDSVERRLESGTFTPPTS
jgi:basic membrane protein A and related proteins